MSTKQVNILDLLEEETLPELNGKYTGLVKDWTPITNAKGGYIEVVLQLPDREYTYCIFPSQVSYVRNCLRRQFKQTDSKVNLTTLLNLAKTKEFNVWFNYNFDYNKMNVAFHEPRIVEDEEAVEL
jgi:hypothetical protein